MIISDEELVEAFQTGREVGRLLENAEALAILLKMKHAGHGGGNWRRLIEMAIEETKKRV